MKTSEHCVKSLKNLSIKTQQGRRQRRRSSIFIVFFGQISHVVLVFLLFSFKK